MDLKIGCTGWRYEGWSGTFYPKFLKSIEWLKYYSTVFDITAINSTYYQGFASATANSLRLELGMSDLVWDEKKQTKLGF